MNPSLISLPLSLSKLKHCPGCNSQGKSSDFKACKECSKRVCKNCWVKGYSGGQNGDENIIVSCSECASGFLSVSQNYLAMLNDPTFTDFSCIVKNKEIKVHKAIFAAASPVFYKMFTSGLKESVQNACMINNMEIQVFDNLRHFLYVGKLLENNKLLLVKLYEAADFYQIENLKEACLQKMKSSMSSSTKSQNIVEIYTFACRYGLKDIQTEAWNIVKRDILHINVPMKKEPLDPEEIEVVLDEFKRYENFRKNYIDETKHPKKFFF